jgi:hypothetical protein
VKGVRQTSTAGSQWATASGTENMAAGAAAGA